MRLSEYRVNEFVCEYRGSLTFQRNYLAIINYLIITERIDEMCVCVTETACWRESVCV